MTHFRNTRPNTPYWAYDDKLGFLLVQVGFMRLLSGRILPRGVKYVTNCQRLAPRFTGHLLLITEEAGDSLEPSTAFQEFCRRSPGPEEDHRKWIRPVRKRRSA